MFSSTTRVCPSTQNGQIAGFLNPVLASCQLVHVAEPGNEPPMWDAHEDVRLLCDELVDKNGAHALARALACRIGVLRIACMRRSLQLLGVPRATHVRLTKKRHVRLACSQPLPQ